MKYLKKPHYTLLLILNATFAAMHAQVAMAQEQEITDLLASYHATVVDGPKAGMFRIVLGDKPLPGAERDQLIARLQSEKVVGFAAAAE